MRNKKKLYISKIISNYFKKPEKGRIILTYHSINLNFNNLTTDIYQLQPNTFSKQLEFIKKNKFISKNFNDLYNSNNGFLITFDDGYKNFLTHALDNILKNNFNVIIFVCPKLIKENNENYLNKDDLCEIAKYKNIEIGSHSYDHVNLSKLNYKDLTYQLDKSKRWIEDTISIKVDKISYPFGGYNSNVIELAKKLNYKKAFTTRFDFYNSIYDDFQIPRVDVWRDDDDNIFSSKLKGKWNWMKYFNKYPYIKQ